MKSVIISKEIHGEAPAEFQLFPYGQIDIEKEPPAILDDEGMDSIIADFRRRGNDMVVDYEHQTLKAVEAPAAAWIKRMINKGRDGLWVVVEWTDRARQYVANKEYRYFSPVFWVSDKGRKIVKVENVALTNYPQINNLKPIIAKHDFDAGVLEVAKMFEHTPEDLKKYGGDPADSRLDESDPKESVLEVAKMFGHTPEDLKKYGGDPADSHLNESDSKESVLEVAKLFGNTPEDIRKYGADRT